MFGFTRAEPNDADVPREHVGDEEIRAERFELMARMADLPGDMVFYTQITMEAAEDSSYLTAMRRARIRGALVGVETVTAEGLKAVHSPSPAHSISRAGRARRSRRR